MFNLEGSSRVNEGFFVVYKMIKIPTLSLVPYWFIKLGVKHAALCPELSKR